jgi:uncharacterized membrane protein YhaH (DUF805 family)
MSLIEAVSSGFRHYLDVSGRASRAEFWYWSLFSSVSQFAISFASTQLWLLFMLGTLPPTVAVSVRRLHDSDRSGWWFALWFVPLVGAIVGLVQASSRGTVGPNRFGDPLRAARPAAAAE